ncbi:MAG: dihydrolipoyl dehydrogenase [Candidatus Alcyoniella australis]|nr:dihydrolipoyl dehydrogenase [Candidatus Alcyoniella australis]
MSENYDVLVLGGGPGGYVAALRCTQLGKRTALVERGALGGVCLNVGCIPSKTMIHGAGLYEQLSRAKDYGVLIDNPRLDFAKLMARKDRVVRRLSAGVGYLCRNRGVEVIKGSGKLVGPDALEVELADGGSRTITAKALILATGGEPVTIPGFEFDEQRVLSSSGALGLKQLPQSMIVLGGGYIGVELGTVYAKLGCKVTIVELMDQLLPGSEAELVEPVVKRLRKMGVETLLSTKAVGLERGESSVILSTRGPEGPRAIEADCILVSVGRRPQTSRIGLQSAGLEPNALGLIEVDASRRTAVPSIYAIGDITPGPQLAHKASHEGIVAAENIAGLKAEFDPTQIPAVVFTDPEIATIGLSEDQALAAGHEIDTGAFPFSASGRAMTRGETEGFIKVIAQRQTGKLLGVRMVGPEVSDLLSEACLALRLGATAEQIVATIHPHPTLGEVLMEACAVTLGKPINI